MITVPEVVVERISVALGHGESLFSLAKQAVGGLKGGADFGGVIAATFSNPDRFPALSVRLVAELGLPASTPAFDVQLACSAYPYALYLAGRLAADTSRPVLVIDGDVQSRLVDTNDHATGNIFSDAVSATVVSSGSGTSRFDFLSRYDDALSCGESGPIRMDGFKVFAFVATEVSRFLKGFDGAYDWFAPHQANPYMIRQLARSLRAEARLLVIDEALKNPGSSSVALTLAANGRTGRTLVAGFGAGYSAAAGIVTVADGFEGNIA